MKHSLTFLLVFALVGITTAQKLDTSAIEKIEAVKDYRRELLKEKLELKENEAEPFISVYNAYNVELRTAKRTFRRKWYDKNIDKLSEADAKLYFQEAMSLQQKEYDLMQQYAPKFAEIIGWSKTIRIKKVENEIQPLLLDRANQLQLEKVPKGKKKG